MLKMISLKERARVVFSNDSSVKASKKDKKDGKVLLLSEAELTGEEKPTVFTVRLLNSRERMQMAEAASLSQTQALFTAAEKAICKVESWTEDGKPKVYESHEQITDLLLSCNPEVVMLLAAWISDQSSVKTDPLGGKK